MNSRIALITVMSAALSAGGLMAATQQPAANRWRANRVDRMSTALNLTAQQQQQAKTIFASERDKAQPFRQQLREDRKTVQSAIQSGKPAAEIQELAKNEGPVLADLAAMRATANAKFYAELNPAQRQKLAEIHQNWRQHHTAGAASETAPLNR